MILGYKDVVEKLASYGRPELINYSVANSSDNFRKILEQLQPAPKRVLEIGTRFGISSTILANMCEYVYTIDIENHPGETDIIWGLFNVRHKIKYIICKNRKEISKIISLLDFDFVFIGGEHDYANVKANYEMVKDCKSILFHDIQTPGVGKFIEEIGAQKLAEMAYLGEHKFKGTFTWKNRKDVYK